MIFDEPVVMATDYALAAGLFAMGARLRAPRARSLFWALAAAAVVGGTRHGLRSTLPPVPLETAWRLALGALGFAGWSLSRSALPARWHRVWDAKLALYAAGLAFTGAFEFGLANFTIDAAAATAAALSGAASPRWFLAGSAAMGAGALLLGLRPPLGGLPPASAFHVIELAGFFCWFRHFRAAEGNP